MKTIHVKDDITISGTVIQTIPGENFVKIKTCNKNEYLICIEDIKSYAPNGNNGGGTRSIVKEESHEEEQQQKSQK